MTANQLLPRYGGGSIADVVESACDGLRVPGAWDVLGLGESARVAVLVIDGLGDLQLADHAELAPFLAAHRTRSLTSVTPATTPVALTSLGTGVAPGRHGIVGASFLLPDTGELLWPLAWRDRPPVEQVQPETTWWQRAERSGIPVAVVAPRAYAGGGLTRAALRGGRYIGADGPGERVAETAAGLGAGERALVYSYWEYLDRAAHMHGVDSPQYRAELVAADAHAAAIAGALPPGSRLLVTSDHGLLDCPQSVDLDDRSDLWEGVARVAGEPRFRHVYTRPGARAQVRRRWQDCLGTAATVVDRDEAVAAGWFGDVGPEAEQRIGDVLAVAEGPVRLSLPSQDAGVSALIGQHGALSPAEMQVPLVVVDN